MSGPRQRLTIKGAFHVLIVLSGWALFAYWWVRVIRQTDSRDAVLALVFGGVTTLATVLVTLLWVRYNVGIFRRKGPRMRVTRIADDSATDVLGRTIVRHGAGSLKSASHLVVSVEGDTKTYEAAQAKIWT